MMAVRPTEEAGAAAAAPAAPAAQLLPLPAATVSQVARLPEAPVAAAPASAGTAELPPGVEDLPPAVGPGVGARTAQPAPPRAVAGAAPSAPTTTSAAAPPPVAMAPPPVVAAPARGQQPLYATSVGMAGASGPAAGTGQRTVATAAAAPGVVAGTAVPRPVPTATAAAPAAHSGTRPARSEAKTAERRPSTFARFVASTQRVLDVVNNATISVLKVGDRVTNAVLAPFDDAFDSNTHRERGQAYGRVVGADYTAGAPGPAPVVARKGASLQSRKGGTVAAAAAAAPVDSATPPTYADAVGGVPVATPVMGSGPAVAAIPAAAPAATASDDAGAGAGAGAGSAGGASGAGAGTTLRGAVVGTAEATYDVVADSLRDMAHWPKAMLGTSRGAPQMSSGVPRAAPAAAAAAPAVVGTPVEEEPLPEGWTQYVDGDGRMYYVNHKTRTQTYTRPAR